MERVSEVLEQRRQETSAVKRPAWLASLILHVVLVLVVFFVPSLFAQRSEPLRYVEVMAIPAADLTPSARPRAARPTPKPPPKIEQPEPEPEPREVPEDIPTIQEKEPEPAPPEPEVEEPTVEPEPEPEEQEESSGPEPAVVAPDGGEQASSSGSAVSQDVGFDDPEFVSLYSYYVERMKALIRQKWNRPPVGNDVELRVRFRIQKNGQVEQLEIVQASGVSSFDLAGLRAVQTASPLPPLPRSYRKPSLGVNLTLR